MRSKRTSSSSLLLLPLFRHWATAYYHPRNDRSRLWNILCIVFFFTKILGVLFDLYFLTFWSSLWNKNVEKKITNKDPEIQGHSSFPFSERKIFSFHSLLATLVEFSVSLVFGRGTKWTKIIKVSFCTFLRETRASSSVELLFTTKKKTLFGAKEKKKNNEEHGRLLNRSSFFSNIHNFNCQCFAAKHEAVIRISFFYFCHFTDRC